MARRMGVGVAMVACLGEDTNGASYLQSLSDEGIDCGSIRKDSTASTGVAQICVEEAGEGEDGGGGNFIVIVPGANNLLSPEDVAAATDRLQGAKIVMVILKFRFWLSGVVLHRLWRVVDVVGGKKKGPYSPIRLS